MLVRDTPNGVTFFHESSSDAIKIGILLERLKVAHINHNLKMDDGDIKGVEIKEDDLVHLLTK